MGQAVGEKRRSRRRAGAGQRLQAAGRWLYSAGARAVGQARCRLRPWMGALGYLGAAVLAGAAWLPFGGTPHMAPFGLALALAVGWDKAFLCCVGCALGGFLALPAPAAVQQTAALLAVGVLRSVPALRGSPWPALTAVAVSSCVCGGFDRVAGSGGVQVWLPQGCLVLALWLLYRQARELRYVPGRRRPAVLALWTSALCCLACLPGPLPWGGAAVGLVTLLAVTAGMVQAVPLLWCGGVLATLVLHHSPAPLLAAVCGSWCGAELYRRGTGRPGVACGYFAAGLVGIFAVTDLTALAWLAAANALAAGLYCLAPRRLVCAPGVPVRDDGSSPAEALTAMAAGLQAVAAATELVGRAADRTAAPEDPDSPIQAACRQVCGGCKQKAHCWGAEYDVTQQALQTFLDRWRADCTGEFAPHFHCVRPGTLRSALLQAEKLRLLRGAGRVEQGVLRTAVSDQYRALADALASLADSRQAGTPQPHWQAALAGLAAGLQLPARHIQALCQPDGSPLVTLTLRPVRLGPGGLQGLAGEVGRICGVPLTGRQLPAADDDMLLQFAPPPGCRARVGVAGAALEGVSGDVTEQLWLGDDLHLLLCDGMGTGPTAADDAKMTALFTARLLRAGFPPYTAARLVNTALLTRASGDRGSTLDLFSFSGRDGAAQLCKAGAAASWLCRGGRLHRLDAGDTLPLGSAETARCHTQRLALAPGDTLVLVSDGLTAAGEGPLLRALQPLADRAGAADPQADAHALLHTLLSAAPPQDDCTLALVRVEEA